MKLKIITLSFLACSVVGLISAIMLLTALFFNNNVISREVTVDFSIRVLGTCSIISYVLYSYGGVKRNSFVSSILSRSNFSILSIFSGCLTVVFAVLFVVNYFWNNDTGSRERFTTLLSWSVFIATALCAIMRYFGYTQNSYVVKASNVATFISAIFAVILAILYIVSFYIWTLTFH